MAETKFLIVGDLHGNKPKIHFKDFDAIIAPGDFCSDRYMRPIIKKWVVYNNKKTKMGEKLNYDFNKFIRSIGVNKKRLNEIHKKSGDDGRMVLAYLNSFNKPVFLVPGNWDVKIGLEKYKDIVDKYLKIYKEFSQPTDEKLINNLQNLHDCHLESHTFKNINIVGYGVSSFPDFPDQKNLTNNQFKKIKKGHERLIKLIEKAYFRRDKSNPTIFISHNVPYKTLDLVINKDSWANKEHYGSKTAREFCLRYKPLVCIGGHIHEHFGKIKLGKTIVINAGFGAKVNTLLTLKDGKIKSIKFYPKTYG